MVATLDDRLVPAPRLAVDHIGLDTVLADGDTDVRVVLDDVAGRMWQAVLGSSCLRAAVGILLDDYDVDPGRVIDDLLDLVHQLEALGLVTVEGSLNAIDA